MAIKKSELYSSLWSAASSGFGRKLSEVLAKGGRVVVTARQGNTYRCAFTGLFGFRNGLQFLLDKRKLSKDNSTRLLTLSWV